MTATRFPTLHAESSDSRGRLNRRSRSARRRGSKAVRCRRAGGAARRLEHRGSERAARSGRSEMPRPQHSQGRRRPMKRRDYSAAAWTHTGAEEKQRALRDGRWRRAKAENRKTTAVAKSKALQKERKVDTTPKEIECQQLQSVREEVDEAHQFVSERLDSDSTAREKNGRRQWLRPTSAAAIDVVSRGLRI